MITTIFVVMVQKGSLKQLKLGMLQNICEELELDVPPRLVRRKELKR